MRLKLGPSSQGERERAKEDTQGERERERERDCESVCVSVFVRTWLHVHVLKCLECVSLYAIEYALCRHLHRLWHIHRGAGCDMKSASSSASGSVPLWIQKSVLWHGPFTSSPACSTIYLCTLWSRAVCAGFGLLAASGFLPVTEREREREVLPLLTYCQAMLGLLWQQDTGHQWMCGEWERIPIYPSVWRNQSIKSVLSIMWLYGGKYTTEAKTEHRTEQPTPL